MKVEALQCTKVIYDVKSIGKGHQLLGVLCIQLTFYLHVGLSAIGCAVRVDHRIKDSEHFQVLRLQYIIFCFIKQVSHTQHGSQYYRRWTMKSNPPEKKAHPPPKFQCSNFISQVGSSGQKIKPPPQKKHQFYLTLKFGERG